MKARKPFSSSLMGAALLAVVAFSIGGAKVTSHAFNEPVLSSGVYLAPDPVEVTFPSGDLTLRGFLYRPDGPGPFPAVLYSHGSEKLPGNKASVAQVFVDAGYVFFVPHRRGQGRSPGPYIVDQLAEARRSGGPAAESVLLVELHEGPQLDDQMAALDFLRSRDFVDPGRIAVAGCSHGGIQTVLAAERGAGLRAAVDFAGAAQSWSFSAHLRDRLTRAVSIIEMPMFFLQAENDYNLSPTKVLAAEMERLGKTHRATIYPPFGSTRDDGHSGFCFNGGPVWGTDVLGFLEQSLR